MSTLTFRHTCPWKRAIVWTLSMAALSSPACSVDLAIPDGARIQCNSEAECPAGRACLNGFCTNVATADFVAPDLSELPSVSPPSGTAAATFAIVLATTETLAAPALVTLALDTIVALDCPARDATHYVCTYTASGSENDGLGGTVAFDVTLTDAAGNSTLRRRAGSFELDFTAPTLAADSIAPAEARLGSQVQVFFTASEPLDFLGARLHVTPALDDTRGIPDGAGGQVFVLDVEPGTLNYRFDHVLTGTDPQSELTFVVSLKDLVGNESTSLPLGTMHVDGLAPVVSGLTTTPARVSASGILTVTFDVDEATADTALLALVGDTAVICGSRQTTSPHYTCSYAMTGDETPPQTEVALLVLVEAIDAAGNRGTASTYAVADFADPDVAAAGVAYAPSSKNPLSTVAAAKADSVSLGHVVPGTRIFVTVLATEALDTSFKPALTASDGATVLIFCIVGECPGDVGPSSLSSTGMTFVATVPVTAGDGDYAPTLVLQDLAGNRNTASGFAAPLIRVKTSQPALVINQTQVTFWRSPWGNAASECLCPPLDASCTPQADAASCSGHFIPAGPHFAVGPGDVLAPDRTIAATAFSLAGGASPSRVRLWTDATMSTLVGSMVSNPDGSWPREQLANSDGLWLYATGVDEAGNESAPVKLVNAEWVATPNPPAFGASPHTLMLTSYASGALPVDPRFSAPAESDASGWDGDAVRRVAEPVWHEWPRTRANATTPKPRANYGLAFDSARGRTVLYGDRSASGEETAVWEWDGQTWDGPLYQSHNPGSLSYHAMAYDSARGVTVLFGGQDSLNVMHNDLWEWNGRSWVGPTAPAVRPVARLRSALAYDSGRGRAVLFGGSGGTGSHGDGKWHDVWEWDGDTWRGPLEPAIHPSPRSDCGAAYDSHRGVVVVFGGSASGGLSDETWEWDGSSWTGPLTPSNRPTPRYGHALSYDSRRERVVLTGGDNGGTRLDDVWEWDGSSWTGPLSPDPRPSPRSNHRLAYDSGRGRVVTFAGSYASPADDGLWEWDGATWFGPFPATTRPERLVNHTLVFDGTRGKVAMYGGSYNYIDAGGEEQTVGTNDLWTWSGGGWIAPLPAAPAPRPTTTFGSAMAYAGFWHRVTLFGGWDTGRTDTVWEWDGAAWVGPTQPSPRPTARLSPVAAYDTFRKRVVVFGGSDDTFVGLNDVWEWDGSVWSGPAMPTPRPSRRYNTALAFDANRGRTVLFGGLAYPGDAPLDDVWEWDGNAWTGPLTPTPRPSARSSHRLAYDSIRKRIVLLGGKGTGYTVFDDLWEWDGATWVGPFAPMTRPAARHDHGMAFDASRGRLVVVGGQVVTGGFGEAADDDVWERDGDPRRRASVQFDAAFAASGILSTTVSGLRVRAACGSTYPPSGVGAALEGFAAGGPTLGPGEWHELDTNLEGLAAAQPYVGSAAGARLDWSALDAEEARHYLLPQQGVTAFRCTSVGESGAGDAAVALDYVEVRVRYSSP